MSFNFYASVAIAVYVLLPSMVQSKTNTDKVSVVVTIPEFKEVFEAIGGDRVEVKSLLSGNEDPHYVDAVPSFITKVAKADIVCAVGLELEIGWLPKVRSKSGNAKAQKGGSGFCQLSDYVDVKNKPTGSIDRSMGDVHAGGNPHYYLSPIALKAVAKKVFELLAQHSDHEKLFFESNYKDFNQKMDALHQEILAEVAPLKKIKIIQFHKEFLYFLEDYGISSFDSIEEKPGVPPSAARIVQISKKAGQNKVDLALGSYHSPVRHLKKFKRVSGIPYVLAPSSVDLFKKDSNTIEKVQRKIIAELRRGKKLKDSMTQATK